MEVVSGIKHPAYREALALTQAGGRQKAGCYLVEGADMVQQALRSPSQVTAVFALPDEARVLAPPCQEQRVPLYSLGAGLLTKMVGTGYETAVTALAVVQPLLLTEWELFQAVEPFLLVGERIQDPRNVGVLIRTAEAAGCTALLLSADSAEPFSRAAVRSTTGSILRLPLYLSKDLPATLAELKARHIPLIASSARAPLLAYEMDLGQRPLAVIVGNETEGISLAVREVASAFVRLPMAPDGASSLNVTVAAGILLYEAVRQRIV